MEIWKYFDITHKEHLICNPSSEEKLDELTHLLQLEPGSRVLELAAGKGELITRLVQRYDVHGVALDLSPYCVADMRQKLSERAPSADVQVLELDGAAYRPDRPESFDLTLCLGASWIFDGHQGTLAALKEMTAPGGWIVVGEPYWLQDPPPQYLEASGIGKDDFGSHYHNMQTGEALGLTLVYTLVSSHDEWDRYESLQWLSSYRYAQENPEDPDVPDLLHRVAKSKEAYLRWGRDYLGWAIYVFRKPAEATA